MRAYIITTALLFLAIAIAHVLRMAVEPGLAREGWYLLLTLLAALLGGWGAVLAVRVGRSR